MMNQLMRGVVTSIAGALLAGCGVYSKGSVPQEFSVVPEYRVGLDGFYTTSKVSRELRTTQPHPNDTFLTGDTTTNNPRGVDAALKVGVVASVGVQTFRVFVGGEARYNFSSAGDPSGVYAEEKQSSDTRPDGGASFVATSLDSRGALLPLAGIEAVIGDVTLRAEVGAPYAQFTLKSGHYRFNEYGWEQKNSWSGVGSHLRGDVLYNFSKDLRVGLSLGYEHFDAEFGGKKADIDSILFAIQAEIKFGR